MWVIENIGNVTASDIFYFGFGSWRLLGVILGAVVAILVITLIYKRVYNIPHSVTLTYFVEAALITVVIGKFACFLEGCCYGIETTVPWAMKFGDSKLRHPTQLYETACLVGILIIIRLLRNKLTITQRCILTTFLYIITRMGIEPLRAEASVFIDGPTRTIYYVLLVICFIILAKDVVSSYIKKKK